jgi:hypothetical protein
VLKLHSFDPEPAFQGLNHLPVGMRIFRVHVERGRISGADSFKSSLAAPLEVRVENPHVLTSSPKALDGASFLPGYVVSSGEG